MPRTKISGVQIRNEIGTYDSSSLFIVTDSTTRVTILPTGEMGIGVPAPTHALDVSGNINVYGGSFLIDGTSAGAVGATGIQGPTGLRGETGVQGNQGDTGLGVQGSTGVAGVQGTTGVQGTVGDQGQTGAQGQTGVQGQAADVMRFKGAVDTTSFFDSLPLNVRLNGDFYTVAVSSATDSSVSPPQTFNTGDEIVWGYDATKWTQVGSTITLVQGDTGIQGSTGVGSQGSTGVSGVAGETGVQGSQGSTGVAGLIGDTGVQGIQGETGIQGSTGVVGATGVQGDTGFRGLTGVAGPDIPVTRVLTVDKNRADSYTEIGSIAKPFKTIQGAIDYVAANAVAGQDWDIQIMTGQYVENLLLEDTGLFSLSMTGLGVVGLNPASGNALQSTTNNLNLTKYRMTNIEITRPVVITGAADSTAFNDTWLQDCKFVTNATLTLNCINNFSLMSSFVETDVSLTNVAWFYSDSARMNGTLAMVCDSTLPAPGGGSSGTVMLNGVYEMGNVTLTKGGTAAGVVVLIGSRVNGSSGTITIPAGWTFQAYNSFVRGNLTNNGTFQQRGSFVEKIFTNTGTWTNDQAASQIKNDSTVSGLTIKDALGTLGAILPVPGATGLQGITGVGSQGSTGLQGLTGVGFQGETGIYGQTGVAGTAGVDGVTGVQGSQGLTGVAGTAGVDGVTGVHGQTGVAGTAGVDGVTGAQGQTGVAGVAGDTGIQGLQGQTGAGIQGQTGVAGIAGETGLQGSTGAGTQGQTGLEGAQGQTGIGLVGQTGVQGPIGQTGLVGDEGLQGETGVQGSTGVGAQGITGVQGLTGAVGFTGMPGQTGIQGIIGVVGDEGLQGETGVAGNLGATGLQGDTGTQGTTGQTGIQGSTGLLGSVTVAPKTSAYAVQVSDSAKVFTNADATAQVEFTLPAGAIGSNYTFIVMDTDGLKVNAHANGLIRVGSQVSSSGGSIDATTIGASLTLVGVDATNWVSTGLSNTWNLN